MFASSGAGCARSARVFGAIAASSCCALAHAGFTEINEPMGFELSHADILQSFYGGTFNPTDGTSLSNGTVFAQRVNDFGFPGIVNTETSDGIDIDDQFWAGLSVLVVPRHVGGTDETGLALINGDGTFQSIAPSTDVGLEFTAGLTGVSRWALANNTTGDLITSNPIDNADGIDHMVTYRITSSIPGLKSRWVIFFEDRLEGQLGNDFDYNDAVFEIIAVPAPATFAALAFAAALPGVTPGARRRRARS